MSKNLMLFLLLIFNFSIFPEKIGSLPEVMKPESITVHQDEIYVVEGATIYIYSLKDLKLVRSFGKKGQGPGELTAGPNYSNKVTILSENILVESLNKLVYFTKDGKFQKEIKKQSPMILQSLPVGKNFVVNKFLPGTDGKTMYSIIWLCDENMNDIKELYRMKAVQQGQPPSATIDMLFDTPLFRIFKNKIFIEKSSEGFIIDVFDSEGEKLYQIKKKYLKRKIPQNFKEKVFTDLKKDSLIKMLGGWDNFSKMFKTTFPETFPAIQGMEVSGDRIYVQTYNTTEAGEEFIIMDLTGQVIKKVMIPKFSRKTLIGTILGTRLHTISNSKVYYLKEDEVNEEWNFYVETIN
jgi:hypothetical protein